MLILMHWLNLTKQEEEVHEVKWIIFILFGQLICKLRSNQSDSPDVYA
jgi:hypothetical protein